MSHQQGIQRKAVPRVFAGEPPADLRPGDRKWLRDRATEWLRRRGLMLPFRKTAIVKKR